jgi:hypothetical protein
MTTATWKGSPTQRTTAPVGRIIEVATVLLLGIATVGSAWCAYQVSQWNDIEADATRASTLARLDASREYALATQKVSYDASTVGTYAEAVIAGNDDLQSFLRTTLVRPGFLPIIDEWERQIAATDVNPENLFEDQAYLDSVYAPSSQLDADAAAASIRGEEANQNAQQYLLATLFMASALFFAGITSSFSARFTRIILLSASAVTLTVAASRLIGYPVA